VGRLNYSEPLTLNPSPRQTRLDRGEGLYRRAFSPFSPVREKGLGDEGARLVLRLTLLIFCLAMPFAYSSPANAQAVSSEVYVTTQDYVSLRGGPARRFDQLAVIPPATTLHAIGRTVNMSWIQVEYAPENSEPQTGWIASWLLVWSGDIISLPVDGVGEREPFIRRSLVMGVTTRETRIYRRQLVSADQVGTIPEGVEVEIAGRLGRGDEFWLQINYEGQLYWVGSWDIRLTAGDYLNVEDTVYLFPYGRLTEQITRDISRSLSSLVSIEAIYIALLEGQSVSCDPDDQPIYAVRVAVDNDIEREPVFAPIVGALDAAITEINSAISEFADACALPDDQEQLTEMGARVALLGLDEARRNLLLASALVTALGERNPLLDDETTISFDAFETVE
jgi:uncharacterized protein YraI